MRNLKPRQAPESIKKAPAKAALMVMESGAGRIAPARLAPAYSARTRT
jgi:hypothetical protein